MIIPRHYLTLIVLILLVLAVLKMKRYEEAGHRFEYMIQTFPDYTAAREVLGAILGEQGKDEEARKYIAESISVMPRDPSQGEHQDW